MGAIAAVKPLVNDATERTLRASRALEGLLRPRLPLVYPLPNSALTDDLPTVTNSATPQITGSFLDHSGADFVSGNAYVGISYVDPSWSTANGGYVDNSERGAPNQGTWGSIAFTLIGDQAEIGWRCGNAIIDFWIWVDGKPIAAQAAAPAGITPVAATRYYTKLAFATTGVRRIEFYLRYGNLNGIRVPATCALASPGPLGPRVYEIGDSLLEGSTGRFDQWGSWGGLIGRAAGWRVYQSGEGGSGFTVNGTSGQMLSDTSSRPDKIVKADPDLALFFIGGNDASSDPAAVQAAVTTCFGYLLAHAPQVPCVLVGGYPNDATSMLSASRALVYKAIRDGAKACANVVGFVDPVGYADTGLVPSALSNGTNYAVGDRYTYLGALWQVRTAHVGGATPDYTRVIRLSWLYGTGTAGALKSDGNRDVLLSNDGTHPTTLGAQAYALWIAQGAAACLQTWLATGVRLGLT